MKRYKYMLANENKIRAITGHVNMPVKNTMEAATYIASFLHFHQFLATNFSRTHGVTSLLIIIY
jgi:hypothetical protein